MLQVLSSIQYICFRKTSVLNIGAPNLLLGPGAIYPRYAPEHICYTFNSDSFRSPGNCEQLPFVAELFAMNFTVTN